MKKLILLTLLFLSCSTEQVKEVEQPQQIEQYRATNITPIFAKNTPLYEGTEARFGCCDGEPLTDTGNPALCTFKEYSVNADIIELGFHASKTFYNCHVDFGSTVIITNGTQIVFGGSYTAPQSGNEVTCEATFEFLEGGGIFETMDDYLATLSVQEFVEQPAFHGLEYGIKDGTGQTIMEGIISEQTIEDINSLTGQNAIKVENGFTKKFQM